MVVGFTTTDAISAYHHWSSEFEPGSGKVYSIQHYVIKFVSDLKQVRGFLWVPPFPPPIKPDRHNIAEILLKVTLNTISLAWKILHFWFPWQYCKTYLYSWTNNKINSDYMYLSYCGKTVYKFDCDHCDLYYSFHNLDRWGLYFCVNKTVNSQLMETSEKD